MKKTFVAALAALPFLAGHVLAADLAADSSTGVVASVWGGANILGSSRGDAGSNPVDESFGLLGGRASMIFGAGSGLMTQLSFEGQSSLLSSDLADDDQVDASGQATAHIMTGAGFGFVGGGGLVGFQDDSGANFYFGGLEYRGEFSGGSVLLQAGAFDTLTTDGDDEIVFQKALFAQFAPQFALGDQLSLGLKASYVTGDLENGDTGYLAGWGVTFEQQLEGTPTSLFVAYDGAYVDGSDAKFDEHSIVGGLRVALGGSREITDPAVHRWIGLSQRTD